MRRGIIINMIVAATMLFSVGVNATVFNLSQSIDITTTNLVNGPQVFDVQDFVVHAGDTINVQVDFGANSLHFEDPSPSTDESLYAWLLAPFTNNFTGTNNGITFYNEFGSAFAPTFSSESPNSCCVHLGTVAFGFVPTSIQMNISQVDYSFTINSLLGGSTTVTDIWFGFGGIEINSTIPNPSPVPEPGTILLMGSGLVSMLGYGWRKRKQAA